MAIIDVECQNADCGRIEEVVRLVSEWPATPPCSKCGAPTGQIHLPAHIRAGSMDPVVVYQAPDGSYRFPPDTDTASTAMYDRQGFTRIEMRGVMDVRRFEKQFNAAQMSEVRQRVERRQEAFERGERERRSEIRRCLDQGFRVPEIDPETRKPTGRMTTVELSPRGRHVLEEAMAHNDRKGGPKAQDVGFHVEAFSYDRSNRERDPKRRSQ